eukprot:TRINITY_DN50847_c0_g1_i1.p1 TRINITY_DN50847_c0_g1~~TRINITY_DN50847_c0_g1_i1.p1  ORF type:complete len:251 (+),score=66.54 TRINITY_DN50847_c0_g1_i1:100-852(+)
MVSNTCKRWALSGVAIFFGSTMITTGWLVLQLGRERLQGATQEMCNVTSVVVHPCSYKCGNVFDGGAAPADGNCSGTYNTYTATSTGQCAAAGHPLTFSEQKDPHYQGVVGVFSVSVKRSYLKVCRCGPQHIAGDCYVGVPSYPVGEVRPCTVARDCSTFVMQNPSDDLATGMLNIGLGVVFILFGLSPDRFARALTDCITKTSAVLVPALYFLMRSATNLLHRWLSAVGALTAAPATRFTQDSDRERRP